MIEPVTAALQPCPLCKQRPKLIHGDRDRGLHPAIARVRYACSGRDGHIVAAAWAEGNLGSTHDSPDLIGEARRAWNTRP